MVLLLFLCLNLSIIHLCVCNYECGYPDSSTKPEIYLIQENHKQAVMNDLLIRSCERSYEFTTAYRNQTTSADNIIYFAAPDYDGKPMRNFVYAGNISKYEDTECNKTNKSDREYDCHEFPNFVSESVRDINHGHLYNFVQKLDYPKPLDPFFYMYEVDFRAFEKSDCTPVRNISDLTVVLHCHGLKKSNVNIKPLKLKQVPKDKCRYLNEKDDGILAILAPEPIYYKGSNLVPMIFYETPYMNSEEKVDFPNSMTLVPWRLLKFGFLSFIKRIGWQRVAIVSDDSEYNIAFGEELAALFYKEKSIVHTVIRCEDAKCNMSKIALKLNNASARIVIANVEPKNARFLIRNTYSRTWIFRDEVGKEVLEYLFRDQIAFSLGLRIDTMTKGCPGVEDNILTSLSSISQAYKNTANDRKDITTREFYRRFAEKMKAATPEITEAEIVIHQLTNKNQKVISRMSVNANGAAFNSFTDPYPNGEPTDGTYHCLVSTYNYYEPCDDNLVIFLMFTLMMFVIIVLLITCYFDKTSPFNDVRYQNF